MPSICFINLFFKSRNCWWLWKKIIFCLFFFYLSWASLMLMLLVFFLVKISFQSRRSLRASLNWLYLSCLIMFLPFFTVSSYSRKVCVIFSLRSFFFVYVQKLTMLRIKKPKLGLKWWELLFKQTKLIFFFGIWH